MRPDAAQADDIDPSGVGPIKLIGGLLDKNVLHP